MGRAGTTTNWAKNQSCVPASTAAPTTVGQLADLVRQATERGDRVKAIGAGHSFTAAAMTTGTLISLDNMPTDLQVDAQGRVRVGAGMTLHALSQRLHDRGRALPNLGDIDVQTIAGATQTATHGTGRHKPNLSAQITGFELVTGRGEVRWCDAETNTEVFVVGRVGLGALGIVTRVELATVPSFNLHAVETVELLDDVLDDWESFTTSAEHAELFWLPGSRKALVKRNHRTTREPDRFEQQKALVEKILVENVAFGAAMKAIRRFPSRRTQVLGLMANLTQSTDRVGRSHDVFASPRHVRFVEMEYGIPIDAMPEAVRRVRDVVESLDDPPSFPIEVRVSAADDIALSTAEGRDSGWIAVHRYRGADHEPYFRAVESILDDYDGRPHWGKLHFQTCETLAGRYPQWDRFAAVRAEVDPHGTFANAYLDRVLGHVGV